MFAKYLLLKKANKLESKSDKFVTISILTLFPKVFQDIFSSSIIGRAQKRKLIKISTVNIRDFAYNRHHQVDDKPYGGGIGMIMRVDIIDKALSSIKLKNKNSVFKEKIVLLDPKGKQFNQSKARSYSKLDHLILICGHYEGIDERISHFIDERISIGKYVLTGGEIPAMVITDAVVRLISGVLVKKQATIEESFGTGGYLEEPQYTRPPVYKGLKVPQVLLSGNHKEISDWRKSKRILLK
ncbi:tRNA (guanosine(37)-N1)-methyltransferase TrmD [Candidatus Gottesmanbacteria bacterium]|nr:tRNA (guanosine(37)-N1)-methyltransferase TrmD [Candidatus Gottesmanbacteria bacterium]